MAGKDVLRIMIYIYQFYCLSLKKPTKTRNNDLKKTVQKQVYLKENVP